MRLTRLRSFGVSPRRQPSSPAIAPAKQGTSHQYTSISPDRPANSGRGPTTSMTQCNGSRSRSNPVWLDIRMYGLGCTPNTGT